MARALEFVFKGESFKGALLKVDREALYGSVDVETRDRDGLKCSVVALASDGRTLIQSGGTAIAQFRPMAAISTAPASCPSMRAAIA